MRGVAWSGVRRGDFLRSCNAQGLGGRAYARDMVFFRRGEVAIPRKGRVDCG